MIFCSQREKAFDRVLKPCDTEKLRLGKKSQNRTPSPQLMGSLRCSAVCELGSPGGLNPANRIRRRYTSCSAVSMDCTYFFISCSQIKSSIIIATPLGVAHGFVPRELPCAKL